MLETPVAFFFFNRPETTRQVFDRIRAAQPRQLFLVADGPRINCASDGERCTAARDLVERAIDWPCAVHRSFSESNMGSGRRISSGLDWVFSKVESAIILEDDCLPDLSFFRFCAELLERFRDEPRVGLISGSHHQVEASHGKASYYFCRYGNTWGWATWRRAWAKFDYSLGAWPEWRDSGEFERFFDNADVRRFWRKTWNESPAKDDVWDYQWTFCYLSQGLLGILPRTAMIKNIGFGADATHTAGMEDVFAKVEPMPFPLEHPTAIEPDFEAEACASRRFFSRESIPKRIVARLSRGAARLRVTGDSE